MRERKQPIQSQLEIEVVIRNEGEWLREAEHLADMLAVVDGLRDDLSTEVRKRRKEIKAREREVSNTARALREGRGNRKQMDLYPTEAQKALHDVAKRAEGKPSEAHVFIPKADSPSAASECVTCGSNREDPMHAPLKVAHAFEGTGKECSLCGALKGDPIHVTLEPVGAGNGKADQAFAFDGNEPAPRVPRAHPGINASKARTRPKGPLSRKARARA